MLNFYTFTKRMTLITKLACQGIIWGLYSTVWFVPILQANENTQQNPIHTETGINSLTSPASNQDLRKKLAEYIRNKKSENSSPAAPRVIDEPSANNLEDIANKENVTANNALETEQENPLLTPARLEHRLKRIQPKDQEANIRRSNELTSSEKFTITSSAELNQLKRIIHQIMHHLTENSDDTAFQLIAENSYLKPATLEETKQNYLKQKDAIADIGGTALGYEFAKSENLGSSLIKLSYMIKYTRLPMIWNFYFYKSNHSWSISSFYWTDDLKSLH